MNNLRLFYQKKLSDNLIGNLDKKQSHYVSTVMRLRENDEFNVFNKSGEWIAQIKKINKTGIEFQIVKQLRSKESRVDIWLAFSPIKSNYFNFMIQKSTELGVTKFIPVIFERSIVRKINNDRLKKIIIEALWDIIYSDENADMYETNLMRRLSGLLYLDPKNVGDIKEKVRQKKI